MTQDAKEEKPGSETIPRLLKKMLISLSFSHFPPSPSFSLISVCSVLRPISAEVKLQLTMKPGVDKDIPQALVSVVMEHIAFSLGKQQVQFVGTRLSAQLDTWSVKCAIVAVFMLRTCMHRSVVCHISSSIPLHCIRVIYKFE